MKLHLATGNPHKLEEVAEIFARAGIGGTVEGPASLGGMPDVEEDADSFAGNALKKARALGGRLPQDANSRTWVMADDSGLCVDALDGAPGVYSSRFSGVSATDGQNTAKLLELLEGTPVEKRTAAFHCCIALISGDGQEQTFEGECPGRILCEARGEGGFGYDPVFVPDGYSLSFAELSPSVKNEISHRARALAALAMWIQKVR